MRAVVALMTRRHFALDPRAGTLLFVGPSEIVRVGLVEVLRAGFRADAREQAKQASVCPVSVGPKGDHGVPRLSSRGCASRTCCGAILSLTPRRPSRRRAL